MMHPFDSPPAHFDSGLHQAQFNYLFDQILAVIKLDEQDESIRAKTLTSLLVKNTETNKVLTSVHLDLRDFA